MCIIIVIPKKKKIPSDDILRRCFSNNPDGVGIMYLHDTSVVIHKGIMSVEKAMEKIKFIHDNYGKNSPLIIHFRIGTSGNKSPECTHPFPISNDYRDLYRLNMVCNSAIAHNGIIFQYEQTNSPLSDTMFFTKMLSGLTSPTMIKRALHGHNASRFVYLNGNGVIIRTGEWLNHKGVFYSNTGYQEPKTINLYSCAGHQVQSYITEYEKNGVIYHNRSILSDEEKEKNKKFQEWIKQYEM